MVYILDQNIELLNLQISVGLFYILMFNIISLAVYIEFGRVGHHERDPLSFNVRLIVLHINFAK
jgi:hypothetical protein